MLAPLIGITSGWVARDGGGSLALRSTYIQAVRRAGGMPVVLPPGLASAPVEDLLNRLDGLLLSGGGDVAIERFGGRPHPRVYGVDEERDTLEIALVQQAAQDGWPLLAICRGIQVLNVALGGTLYTHIADQLPNALAHEHDESKPYDYPAHPIFLQPGSQLAGILDASSSSGGAGSRLMVNSLHHQGVERLAEPLRAVAHAPDGLIEAVELPGHPFLIGVQWHPEWMPDSLPMQALFRAFIQAAQSGRKTILGEQRAKAESNVDHPADTTSNHDQQLELWG